MFRWLLRSLLVAGLFVVCGTVARATDDITVTTTPGTTVGAGFGELTPGPHDLSITVQVDGYSLTGPYVSVWAMDSHGLLIWETDSAGSTPTQPRVVCYGATEDTFGCVTISGYSYDPSDATTMSDIGTAVIANATFPCASCSYDPNDPGGCMMSMGCDPTRESDLFIAPGSMQTVSVTIQSSLPGTLTVTSEGSHIDIIGPSSIPITGPTTVTFTLQADAAFTNESAVRCAFLPNNGPQGCDTQDVLKVKRTIIIGPTGIELYAEGRSTALANGETIYVPKGSPGSTLLIAASSLPAGAIWRSGEPNWSGVGSTVPGIPAVRTVPIDQPSNSAAGETLTASVLNVSVSVNIVVVELKVTPIDDPTSNVDDLKIIQNLGQHRITLTADIHPAGLPVTWSLNSQPADVVKLISAGTACDVLLDKTVGGWSDWESDFVVNVRAECTACPDAYDYGSVMALKFMRDGRCAPGSSAIHVPIPFNETGAIGHFLEGRTELPGAYAQGGVARMKTPDAYAIYPAIGSFSDSDSGTMEWKINYQSSNDRGDGTYSVQNAKVLFKANGVSNGIFAGAGWHVFTTNQGSAGAASSASLDGSATDFTEYKCGVGFDAAASPYSFNFGITFNADKTGITGGGVGGGISFSGTADANNQTDDDTYDSLENKSITSANGAHGAMQPLMPPFVKPIKIAAAAVLRQGGWSNYPALPDYDWKLHAEGRTEAWIPAGGGATGNQLNPETVEIHFVPSM